MLARTLAPLITLALAACGTLSAKAPLFSTADQTEPAPVQEGVWIAVSEACPASMLEAATYPSDCMPVELRRASDGAWLLTPRDDLVRDRAPNEERSRTIRMILAPMAIDEALFIAEMREVQARADDDMSYAVIAPRGGAPESRFSALLVLDCESVLGEGGPIAGLAITYTRPTDAEDSAHVKPTKARIQSCVASTQSAVREAARRAWVLNGEAALQGVFTRVRP